MFRFIALALFAAATATDVIFDGPCPEVKPVQNFEFEAYQGTWYEVAKYPNYNEEGSKGKCTVAEYSVDGDKGKVKNTHVIDGIRSYIEGDLTLVAPSKVMLTYTFGVWSWIKSRSKKLDCEAKYKVEEYLRNSKVLDYAKYALNDHSESACSFSTTKAITEFYK